MDVGGRATSGTVAERTIVSNIGFILVLFFFNIEELNGMRSS